MARQETYYDSTVSRNISVSGSSYEFGLDSSDQILLSIQDDLDFNLNTFVLEQNIDYIISNNEIFLKPNDILDKEETPTGTYNLKFTYCRNILQEFPLLQVYDNPVHVVTEISNTRTEVRLRVRDENNYNILSINPNISTGYVNKIKQDKFGSEESLDTYHFDYVIDTGDQNFIPINKIDIAIHHILIIVLGYYVINTSKVYNNVVTTEILKTEISSIFLALNSILKHPKLYNSILLGISNVLFILLFTYYRVLSLTYSVLFNLDYRLTIVNEFNKQTGDLNYKLNVLFLFLNYYWFYKICKLINRELEKANFYNRLRMAFKEVMNKN